MSVKTPIMDISVNRSGKFKTPMQVGIEGKCGTPDAMEYEYDVIVEGTSERLSPEGFLIDNSKIFRYFDLTYTKAQTPYKAESCERMAMRAAQAIGEYLVAENISVTRVTVVIVGSNLTRLKAVWDVNKVSMRRIEELLAYGVEKSARGHALNPSVV